MIKKIDTILTKDKMSRDDLIYLLKLTSRDDIQYLYDRAYAVKEQYVGKVAYYRGLIEFSNKCRKNCLYCGIRRDNKRAIRFDMTRDEILQMAYFAYENQYGSVTLQSGERTDEKFIDYVEKLIWEIKRITKGELGITLSLGEQDKNAYQRWFNAGAHRYLLRIETSNPTLYGKLHPQDDNHSWQKRVDCLRELGKIGYQVGTGVMIGSPGQTIEDLADDILFYEKIDADMIGMGPYIVHHDTPLGQTVMQANNYDKHQHMELSLKMIAITRLYLKDVNIAATTALQALNPVGRELGLKAGANILMPVLTVSQHRSKYMLYDNKPCIDDNAAQCRDCLAGRIAGIGETIGYAKWGDAKHYFKKNAAIFKTK